MMQLVFKHAFTLLSKSSIWTCN